MAGAAPKTLADSDGTSDLLRAGFETAPEPLMLIQAVRDDAGSVVDFTYLALNAAACRNLGVAKERLIGRTLTATLPNFAESGLLKRYAVCLDSGEPVVADGHPYSLFAESRHCDIRAGRTSENVLTVAWRDVTERFDSVRRIEASEQQFRLLAQSLGEAVFRIADDGTILWMSKSAEQDFGPANAAVGRRIEDFVPRDELPHHFARLSAASRGESMAGRARVLGADGGLHWIHFFLKPFHGSDGNPDGLLLTCRIIDTEVAVEQQAEQAGRAQAQADARWRRMLETAAVGMAVAEPGGRFETVNQAICDFFGRDEETLKQLTWQELTAPEFLEADLASVERLLAGKIGHYRTVKQFVHADGHRIWGDLSVTVLREADGGIERFVGQITDITAEVEARRTLTRREEQNRILARRLQEQSDQMTAELVSAAAYVASILPGPLDGRVEVSSRYIASRGLAGDCFDYRWIDDDHLIVYLLDVSGHGIQSALLSVSVHNLLRSGSFPADLLLQPDQVLAELNEIFSMEKHAGNYFTMWFGVYAPSTRTLRYASGGHPPALLLGTGRDVPSVTPLSTRGMPVGMFADAEFVCDTASIAAGDTLLIYSDGAYEMPLAAGRTWSLDTFIDECRGLAGTPDWTLDTLVDSLRDRAATGVFDDDLSLVRLNFG